MKRLFKQNPFKGLAVPTVGGGVAQHPLDVLHLGFVVATAFSQESPPDIAVQIDRFSRPVVFGDVEEQNRLAANVHPLLGYVNIVIDLSVGMKDGQEVVLHLVGFINAGDIELFATLGNAEHQPAAVGVGECRNGLKRGFWNRHSSFLELDVVPFPCLEQPF